LTQRLADPLCGDDKEPFLDKARKKFLELDTTSLGKLGPGQVRRLAEWALLRSTNLPEARCALEADQLAHRVSFDLSDHWVNFDEFAIWLEMTSTKLLEESPQADQKDWTDTVDRSEIFHNSIGHRLDGACTGTPCKDPLQGNLKEGNLMEKPSSPAALEVDGLSSTDHFLAAMGNVGSLVSNFVGLSEEPPTQSTPLSSTAEADGDEITFWGGDSSRRAQEKTGVDVGLSSEEALAVGERNNYNTQHSVSIEFANDSYDRESHSPKNSPVTAGLSTEDALAVGERNNYNTQNSVSMDFANDSYHSAAMGESNHSEKDEESKELMSQSELRALAGKLNVALPAEEEYIPFKELQVIALELGQGVRDVNLAVNEEELINLIKSAVDGQTL